MVKEYFINWENKSGRERNVQEKINEPNNKKVFFIKLLRKKIPN